MTTEFRPGFRFSVIDAIAILVAIAAAIVLWPLGPISWLPVVTLGHFFLFCNVFRVRRSYEIAWTILFLANLAFGLADGQPDWLRALTIQLPITAIVIAFEMKSDNYHGWLWRRINPDLEIRPPADR